MPTEIIPLRVSFAGSAIAGFIALISPATAQWAPPWGAVWPGEMERGLKTEGYVLTAPLMRRPGVYLADVSSGPGRYQRLIIDAKSGRILESFPASARILGATFADRDDSFGEPQPSVGRPLNPRFFGVPAAAPPLTYPGPASLHIPTAISPYGAGATNGTRAQLKATSIEHKVSGIKTARNTNPPLPLPAPREAAKADEPGVLASKLYQPPTDDRPHEVQKVRPAAPRPSQDASTETSDKPKVNIVPPALFE